MITVKCQRVYCNNNTTCDGDIPDRVSEIYPSCATILCEAVKVLKISILLIAISIPCSGRYISTTSINIIGNEGW